MLAALESRDPDAAEAAMRTHIRNSRASINHLVAAATFALP